MKNYLASIFLGISVIALTLTSFQLSTHNKSEKETMIIVANSLQNLSTLRVSKNGEDFEEIRIKKTERLDYNFAIDYLNKSYNENWKLISSNMSMDGSARSVIIYFHLER